MIDELKEAEELDLIPEEDEQTSVSDEESSEVSGTETAETEPEPSDDDWVNQSLKELGLENRWKGESDREVVRKALESYRNLERQYYQTRQQQQPNQQPNQQPYQQPNQQLQGEDDFSFLDPYVTDRAAYIAQQIAQQQFEIMYDQRRCKEYVQDNPELIANQHVINGIFAQNGLTPNFDGLREAHRIFKQGLDQSNEAAQQFQQSAYQRGMETQKSKQRAAVETGGKPSRQRDRSDTLEALRQKYPIGEIPEDLLIKAIGSAGKEPD